MWIIESMLVLLGPNVDPADNKVILNLVEFDDETGEQLQDDTMEIWENQMPSAKEKWAQNDDGSFEPSVAGAIAGWRQMDKAESKLFRDLHKMMDKYLRDAIEKGDRKNSREKAKDAKRPAWMDKVT